jgi:acetyl-CoA carboxylase biotin carboxyl carrier protein
MDLKQIQELIRFVSKAGVSEVQLEQDDFKIVIKTGKEESHQPMQMAPQQIYHAATPVQVTPQAAPAEAPQAAAAAPKAEAAPAANTETIKSPMIGTFYRKPSPDKDVFVKVGDMVSKGQVVCVIEAMKLFNEIESDVSGKIVKILVEDTSPVEYDQPLFLVEPA